MATKIEEPTGYDFHGVSLTQVLGWGRVDKVGMKKDRRCDYLSQNIIRMSSHLKIKNT